MLLIVNNYGLEFNVVCVRRGDRYGLENSLVHTLDDPLIEFYQQTKENDRLGTVGQFVASYTARTLLADEANRGLMLRAGSPQLCISADNFRAVREWIADGCPER